MRLEPLQLKAEMRLCAERVEIWEYSSINLPTWEKVGYKKIKLVPMGVVFLSGLYGDARDQLISRAKIVLNMNLYEFSQICEFEIIARRDVREILRGALNNDAPDQ